MGESDCCGENHCRHAFIGDDASSFTHVGDGRGKDIYVGKSQFFARVRFPSLCTYLCLPKVMKDHQNQGVPLPPGASEQMDYIRVVETRRMEATAARQQQLQQQQRLQQQQQQQQQMKAGSVRVTSSFRDVVEAFAESSGVMFLPKPGRQHEGKQASAVAILFDARIRTCWGYHGGLEQEQTTWNGVRFFYRVCRDMASPVLSSSDTSGYIYID